MEIVVSLLEWDIQWVFPQVYFLTRMRLKAVKFATRKNLDGVSNGQQPVVAVIQSNPEQIATDRRLHS